MGSIAISFPQLDRIEGILNNILVTLRGVVGIRILIDGKEENMANFQLTVGFKVPYLVQEVDTTKTPNVVVPPLATDTFTVVSSSVNVVVAPDAVVAPGAIASGFLVAGSPEVGVTVTATVTKADGTMLGSPKIQTIDVVAVVPPPEVANDISFTLGTPVSQ